MAQKCIKSENYSSNILHAHTRLYTNRINNNILHYRIFSNHSYFILLTVCYWVFLAFFSVTLAHLYALTENSHLTACLHHLYTSNNQRGKDVRGNRKEEYMMTEESWELDSSIWLYFVFFFLNIYV